MADLILKVTPEEVHTKAAQIQNKANELRTLMGEMKTMVDNLINVWNSESGRTYQEQYSNVTRNIERSLETLEQQVRNLEEAASRYEELEQSQRAAASSLSTENIF